MEAAARAKGWGLYRTAGLGGWAHTTVRNWWLGKLQPTPDNLTKYAALVEVPVEEFEKLRELKPTDVKRRAEEIRDEMLDQFLRAVEAGERPAVAYRRAAGPQVKNPFRAALDELAGGDWDKVPAERREKIVRALLASAGALRSLPPER